MTEIIKMGEGYAITIDGKPYARILAVEGATDTFERIEDGAWKWHRHTDIPTDNMRMEMVLLGEPTFTMVPSISYNGNGWGTMPEYVGDFAEDGTPWSWAWHRATIPACTYSENESISIALMCDTGTNCACSLYKVDEGKKHVLIFPEEEKPKTLHRHFWGEPFQGTMEPTSDFEGIILAYESDGSKHRYKRLLDFAWRYYGHPIAPPRTAEEIYKLSITYTRSLYEREEDGFAGFVTGSQWQACTNAYKKMEHRYELGWVGQSASMSVACINNYIKNGCKDDLELAIEALDKWIEYGETKGKFLASKINDHEPLRTIRFEDMTAADISKWEWGEDMYESILGRVGKPVKRDENGRTILRHDACNLGTGADCYFEAYDMLQSIGIDKPEYLKAAIQTCEFALESQDENGSFAKSWDKHGNVTAKKGTIGCFLILPLIKATKHTDDKKYLDSAIRAFDFYYEELEREGFTTAGALDTYSIDKESSSPLLRDALALYEVTGNKKYITCAEKIAWYLCTWMMHFTITYPEDCLISQLGYDTFGSTSVSTPHQALDQYALRDVLSFLKLYELTGYKQWRERALAFWCNACQGISDGTLYINRRVRPAGSQDEAVFHTRWGRHYSGPFGLSQWLPAWPCAFRLENLRWHKDWSFFNEGLTEIEGKIK